jgi:hypothetical protein
MHVFLHKFEGIAGNGTAFISGTASTQGSKAQNSQSRVHVENENLNQEGPLNQGKREGIGRTETAYETARPARGKRNDSPQ